MSAPPAKTLQLQCGRLESEHGRFSVLFFHLIYMALTPRNSAVTLPCCVLYVCEEGSGTCTVLQKKREGQLFK